MDPRRAERVSEALREELEEMIAWELEDPRIQDSDVIEVLISPDGRKARVRLRIKGDAAAQQETVEALEHARNYLRRELTQRLGIFRVPDLHFESAIPAALDQKADKLLRRIRRGRPRDGEEAHSPSGAE
jgi:ribosome-binding factor A